jgi:alpha-glucuronidase
VINNVNADARILEPESLRKVAALADVWRPFGVRMYLSANFAAPMRLGGSPPPIRWSGTWADWWKAKADEIYRLIPDFGGFFGQSKLRRPTRTKNLWPYSRRGGKCAGRCARPA